MTRKVSLTVNDSSIQLDYFVASFIDHTTGGMVESLEDAPPMKDLVLTISGDKVGIVVNGAEVRANAFVSKIVKSTVNGMLSPLKGVTTPDRVKIEISR